MATSGSKSITVTSYDTLKFSWEESSQSIADNTTTISWKMQLISTEYGKIVSSVKKDWKVVVNDKTYSGQNYVSIGASTTKTLASGTTTIAHNSDGTKTFSYSFSQEFAINFNGYVGTKSSSGTGTLDTIPRKSTLTVAAETLGTAQTLKITEKASAFNHKLKYTCGSASGWIIGDSDSTSSTLEKSWTPPISLASQNTAGTSVSIKFTLYTFKGSTNIGSNSYTKSFAIPSSVKPSCSVAVSDANGYKDKYGGYVKGKSKFKVVVTPTKSYDSAIVSYSTTANGLTYPSASFTTGVLASSGTLTVSAKVTDKRGRSGTDSEDATVLNYANPSITSLKVMRCDTDGNENLQGENVKVTFSSSVTGLNSKNKATYKLEYKKSTDSTYTAVTLSDYSNNYAVSNGTYMFAADTGSSYNVKLTVTDDFGSTSKSTSASTAFSLMHFNQSGKGLAFGKVSEEDCVDIALKLKTRDTIELANDKGLRGRTTQGNSRSLAYVTTADNYLFGNGSYYYKEGTVSYDGNKVQIRANDTITSNKTITVSSDARLKENIVKFGDAVMFSSEESDVYTELFDKLQPASFNYIEGNGKTCFGLIAQDVIEALHQLGIDESEVDLINETKLDENAESTYGIAYGNLHALQIHKIKKLEKRIAELEAMIDKLLPI